MAAESAAATLPALPKDLLDVRTAKYDVDGNGHVRHLITSEVYLHSPATPRSALLVNGGSGAVAKSHGDVVENVLHYITTHIGPGRPVTGSALADTKFPRFVARSRFAELLLLRDTGAGKFVFPLVHIHQLYDPTISALYIALPPADEAVAKAAALDAGTYVGGTPPPLGPTLPGYTVTLKLLVEQGDEWGHAAAITAPDFAPTMPSVSRTAIVPSTVSEDDSPTALQAVTEAAVQYYTNANPLLMDMFTEDQRSSIRLGVGLSTPVPPLRAASPTGAVFPAPAMNGGAIPLRTVKQLQDGNVTTVFLIVPSLAPHIPPPPTPPPSAPTAESSPPQPPLQDEEGPEQAGPEPSGGDAPAVEVPLAVGDIVDAVSMDGSFTRKAEVKEVRPFGVMGDVTVTVLFEGAPFPFAGLPRSHILRVITPAWAREGAQ